METWFIIIVSLCVFALLKSLYNLFFLSYNSSATNNKNKQLLPPGPPAFPIIGNLLWLRKSFWELEPILRRFRLKYGPLITLRIGSHLAIFVATHSLAHRALIQNGAVFSDRPRPGATGQVLNVSSAPYGPTWRLLRRNLTSEILHPSRVKSYSRARQWVLGILIDRLLLVASQSESPVVDEFRYAMFCLLVLMCFGDKLEEKQIKEIETVHRRLLLSFGRFNILNFWPRLGKIVFRNRWKELIKLRQDQDNVLIPLIKSRIKAAAKSQQQYKARKENNKLERVYQETITTPSCHDEVEEEDCVVAYVDTLIDLQLPDKKRKLNYGEMASLCEEFLTGGTDTTSTALQWIMANLVKYPHIQAKLYEEITGALGPPPPPPSSKKEWERKGSSGTEDGYPVLNEGDLQKMSYLKAVVLEGLRRHPPGHFVLPHSVTEDVELEGYVVPKNASVNFMVAEMGWDPKVWDDPMEFKPERFLLTTNGTGTGTAGHDKEEYGGGEEAFDITGSREIKMMPFGAGRRICPGSGLALLHLEYFVANLIWYFEWKAVDGDNVDLSEKFEFTVVMKNPLRAHVSSRVKSTAAT